MSFVVKMSLGIDQDTLHLIEITRRGPYKKRKDSPDDWNRYIVRVDGIEHGHIMHRYGDDAFRLVELACEGIRICKAGMPDPYPDE